MNQASLRALGAWHLTRARRARFQSGGQPGDGVAAFPRWRRSGGTTYVVCTNPRSGSWLLSDGLASTGRAGHPREWFNTLHLQHFCEQWRAAHGEALDFARYVELAGAASATRNGVSGLKIHYYQLCELPEMFAAIEDIGMVSPARILRTLLPGARYLWLRRRDKVRQAISYQLAAATARWWAIEGVPNPGERPAGPVEFDAEAIALKEAALVENELRWRSFFDTNGIVPRILDYEDLAADYEGTIRRTLSWLGVQAAGAIDIARPRLQRQSSGINEEWVVRYREFKARAVTSSRRPDQPSKPPDSIEPDTP